MKINWLVIIIITAAVSWLGSSITSRGLDWYYTLNLPSFTPPGSVIGTVWTIIYTLTAISAIIVYNRLFKAKYYKLILLMFGVNALLNIGWSFVFFGQQLIGPAVIAAALLGLSVLTIIILTWRHSLIAAVLLLPYVCWVSFATYLNYAIWRLN